MPASTLPLPSLCRIVLASVALAFATATRAEIGQGGFTATLSLDQKNAIGLATLSTEERDALDQLVKNELTQARTDGSIELDGTFARRHPEGELHRAGL